MSRLLEGLAGRIPTMPTIGSVHPAASPTFPSILPVEFLCALRNFGSDILWAYALTAALAFILGTRRRSVILSATIAAALGALLEAAQLTGLINGTFDPLDILFETAAALAAASIIHLVLHGGEYEKLRKSPKHRSDPGSFHSNGSSIIIQVQGDQSDRDR